MIQHDLNQYQSAVIKLIGIGGGGCNAVEQMINAEICGVEFMCVNTDAQALSRFSQDNIIQLGSDITRGLGAGTDPEIGRLAAEEDRDRIAQAIGSADMLFLTAGMGGGTGTGGIPVIAQIARELGVLTVAVITKPFSFEGSKRMQVAEAGIEELRNNVDSLIVVPNENLLTHLGPNTTLLEAFAASNDILTNAVQSIAELVTNPGLINVDFADVRAVMSEMGEGMMSSGRGIGEYRARDAAIAASESPLIDGVNLKGARGILANVTGGSSLSMGEFQIVGDILKQITADDANVVIGTSIDQNMGEEIRVTVVATGLDRSRVPAANPITDDTVLATARTGVSQFLNTGKSPVHSQPPRLPNVSAKKPDRKCIACGTSLIPSATAQSKAAKTKTRFSGSRTTSTKASQLRHITTPSAPAISSIQRLKSPYGIGAMAGIALLLMGVVFITAQRSEPTAAVDSVVKSDGVLELPADFQKFSEVME